MSDNCFIELQEEAFAENLTRGHEFRRSFAKSRRLRHVVGELIPRLNARKADKRIDLAKTVEEHDLANLVLERLRDNALLAHEKREFPDGLLADQLVPIGHLDVLVRDLSRLLGQTLLLNRRPDIIHAIRPQLDKHSLRLPHRKRHLQHFHVRDDTQDRPVVRHKLRKFVLTRGYRENRDRNGEPAVRRTQKDGAKLFLAFGKTVGIVPKVRMVASTCGQRLLSNLAKRLGERLALAAALAFHPQVFGLH